MTRILTWLGLALFCSACWQDHLGAVPRLSDTEARAFKDCSTPEAQLRWLIDHDLLEAGDFKKPGFSRLSQEARIKAWIDLHPALPQDEKSRLRAGTFRRGDKADTIRVLFGPPPEADTTGELETWSYREYDFHFVQGKLVDWARY